MYCIASTIAYNYLMMFTQESTVVNVRMSEYIFKKLTTYFSRPKIINQTRFYNRGHPPMGQRVVDKGDQERCC